MNDFTQKEPSSFRDPSGFLFEQNHELFRQINNSYKNQYDKLMNSGLYDSLVENFFLIPHDEIEINLKNIILSHIHMNGLFHN